MATATETFAIAPAISASNAGSSLKINPLAPFLAEVSGLRFSEPVTDSLHDNTETIFATYGVVFIWKNGPTTDKQLIDFARQFGELDSVAQHWKQGIGCRVPHDEIFDVGNLDAKDEIIDMSKAPRKVASGNGNALWHADGSFNRRRTGLSMLRDVVKNVTNTVLTVYYWTVTLTQHQCRRPVERQRHASSAAGPLR